MLTYRFPKQRVRAGARSILWFVFAFVAAISSAAPLPGRWTPERAKQWMAERPYLAGGNYVPQTAINQLEMWQAETFDLATIDREFGWAESVGFNVMRVYLHNLAWKQNPRAFLDRVDQFLGVADKHGISVLFVFFDSCWNPHPRAGKQPAPRPGVHNSGWVQSPGIEMLMNGRAHGELEAYVKDVLTRFGNDRRIVGWDLFNEPSNGSDPASSDPESRYKAQYALILLDSVFRWAREINPSQPLTVALWDGDWSPGKRSQIDTFVLENSDVVSFHAYSNADDLRAKIELLEREGRPLICSEFMARTVGSRWETHLPIMKAHGVAAIQWGFVSGKSQTIFPWESLAKQQGSESEWFHDLLHPDGTPYREAEVKAIRGILKR